MAQMDPDYLPFGQSVKALMALNGEMTSMTPALPFETGFQECLSRGEL